MMLRFANPTFITERSLQVTPLTA